MVKLTNLVRAIDLQYPTNLAIFLVSLGTWLLSWIFVSWEVGISLGIGVFLAWALTRELDPADEQVAFFAAALYLSFGLYYPTNSLMSLFLILLLLRIIAKTIGLVPTKFDYLGLIGLTAYLTWQVSIAWPVILMLALSFDIYLSSLHSGLRLEIKADRINEKLWIKRIRVGRLFALLILLGALWLPGLKITELLPLLASIAAVGIVTLARHKS